MTAHLEHWLKLYQSPNPAVRERAAAGLLRSGEGVPLRILVELLESPSADLRSQASSALVQREDPELLPIMAARLSAAAAEERMTAFSIVARMDPALAEYHARQMLTDPDPEVRRWARLKLRHVRGREGDRATEPAPVDAALKRRVYDALADEASRLGPEGLSPAKRHAFLAWWAREIVGNGGLLYFYEGASEGEEVADACEALGFPAVAQAFRQSLAIFPNGKRR